MPKGRILKAISGFYYVDTEGEGIIACRAKGLFRNQGIKPYVGDEVELVITDVKDREGNVTGILPRKTLIDRPPVANVDTVVVCFAIHSPEPNLNLLDRYLIMAKTRGVDVVIGFNKSDLSDNDWHERLFSIYEAYPAPVVFLSAKTGEGIEELRGILSGHIATLAGPSGAGKSSLLNALQSDVRMETGGLSRKNERGRQTTRHTQLIKIADGSYLSDTPGFGTLGLPAIGAEELKELYPEYVRLEGNCRFAGCLHLKEPDCAVKDAVEAGALPKERYDNYVAFSEELRSDKNRYNRKN